jgi:alkyl hydroperoxide reductase subunit AhpC
LNFGHDLEGMVGQQAPVEKIGEHQSHGEVARLYGVFRAADGYSERANIVVDEKQKVVFAKIYPSAQLPDIGEIIRFLAR